MICPCVPELIVPAPVGVPQVKFPEASTNNASPFDPVVVGKTQVIFDDRVELALNAT